MPCRKRWSLDVAKPVLSLLSDVSITFKLLLNQNNLKTFGYRPVSSAKFFGGSMSFEDITCIVDSHVLPNASSWTADGCLDMRNPQIIECSRAW